MVLKNFVTYDYCEVKPGPQLNMIIGPNGTGKSTIVCAIALGLDGSPSVLGRSKNVTDFIKTGTDEATIQIELKQVRSRNTTIRRIIKSNGTTLWHLNGSHATRKEITAVIRDLNIQVDNLCQFLPQDKVAEFAQLTPSLLLTRTQSAVGERKMLEWHGTLIDLRKQENTLRQVR
ncbi:P-loop containing nucleoside triphosphate hydrolase protein [Hesseltinella vesiculosa]|uniref:Structural maintenance of chromosomes protein 5 n=1 Tax=Hesseltinella vesiculosa TaxID=101127 RepID=A0A1X2GJ35_9FUNG|nr:P-loop containing nucleoside triphosphate hydrolase protein [Hesseltinella vesiculosa]